MPHPRCTLTLHGATWIRCARTEDNRLYTYPWNIYWRACDHISSHCKSGVHAATHHFFMALCSPWQTIHHSTELHASIPQNRPVLKKRLRVGCAMLRSRYVQPQEMCLDGSLLAQSTSTSANLHRTCNRKQGATGLCSMARGAWILHMLHGIEFLAIKIASCTLAVQCRTLPRIIATRWSNEPCDEVDQNSRNSATCPSGLSCMLGPVS